MSKEFENILDRETAKMGDYTGTYKFFRDNWLKFIEMNPYMRLKEAIDIKNMYDIIHSTPEIAMPLYFRHGGGKKATKKKRKNKKKR